MPFYADIKLIPRLQITTYKTFDLNSVLGKPSLIQTCKFSNLSITDYVTLKSNQICVVVEYGSECVGFVSSR